MSMKRGLTKALVLALVLGGLLWIALRPRPSGYPREAQVVVTELRDLLRAQDAYRAERPSEGYASSVAELVEAGFGSDADWADGTVQRYTIEMRARPVGPAGALDALEIAAFRPEPLRPDTFFADESTIIRTSGYDPDMDRPLAADQVRLLDLTEGARELVAEVGVRMVRVDTRSGNALRRVTTPADRVSFGVDGEGRGFLWRIDRAIASVWPEEDPMRMSELPPPEGIYYFDVSHDGSMLLGRGAQSYAITVSDAADPGVVRTLWSDPRSMNATRFGFAGLDLAYGSGFERIERPDGSWYRGAAILRIWSAASGEELQVLRGTYEMAAVTFSREGSWVMTRANGGSAVAVRDVGTGALSHRLVQDPSGQPASHVVLSPDASVLATVGRDGVTNVWDAATGERRAAVPTGSIGSIWRDAAFSADASLMVARGPERLAVFDVPSESLLHTLIDTHEEGHARLGWWAIDPDGDTVWAVIDQEIRSWSMRSGEAGRRIDLPSDARDPMLVFDGNGRLLAVDRSFRPNEPTTVWDVERGEAAYTLPAAQTTLAHTELPIAVTGSMADGRFVVHDLTSRAQVGSVTIPPDHMAVAFSDDGRWLVSVARQDRAILVTSLADGDTVVAIPDAGAQVEANQRPLAVSAQAGIIAYAERASQYPMTIWDVRTGALVRALELRSPYSARAISESGLVMMVDGRGEGSLMDARSGETVAELGRGPFVDALFDASGTRLATLSGEGVVSIHDVETGDVIAVVSLPEVAGP